MSTTAHPRRPAPGALALALGATGCGSTQIANQWRNPSYVAPRFSKVLVVGVSRQPSIRRTFEDAFVARLGAAGVNDARDNQLVRAVPAQTRSSGVIDEEIEDYVDAVIKALAKANLLTGA